MTDFFDRTSFWVFVIDIPHLHGKELLSAIKIKLGSLFPGSLEDFNIQIRKNGVKKDSYLVFVLNKDTGKEMLPVSTLFVQYLNAQKDASCLFLHKTYLDFIQIQNGKIISSVVKARNDDTLIEDIKLFFADELSIIVYCEEYDKDLFTNIDENIQIQIIDIGTELKKLDIHKISLFAERSPIVLRKRILLAASLLSLVILGSFLIYQNHEYEKERMASFRLEQEMRQKEEMERRKELQLLEELTNRYNEIIKNKTATPFEIALVISECSNNQTRIQSATFNRNFFQIEGLTNSSLGLLQNFETHRLVETARLHQVHPFGNRDTFTLSGTVSPYSQTVDKDIPVREQISILKYLIAIETENLFSGAQLSPSAFGSQVNALFTKWGCRVISYQFMNDPQKTELELSLRGTGSGFFNALFEIKSNYKLWDIHLTQIKNLYPRNLLDVIMRIKTEYVNTKPETNNFTETNITQNSVASISRNYFLREALPRAQMQTSIVQQPVLPPPVTVRGERASWLEYVGSIQIEGEGRYIYIKNTRTGAVMRLSQHTEGDMRYAVNTQGGIIAYIDEHIYEISRR